MDETDDRIYWRQMLSRLARPVLTAAAGRRLRADMPVECGGDGTVEDRAGFTHLEAVGRLLGGMAPYLEGDGGDPGEQEERARFRQLAREALDAGTDPDSPDFFNFSRGEQPVVDASLLAQALLYAPTQLWQPLPARVRKNVIAALRSTRAIRPGFNNHLLFSAMIETFLFVAGEPDWDKMRIDYALRQHEQWYAGDGCYRDGPDFHFDYYNSFIIHPFLVLILRHVHGQENWQRLCEPVRARARRFAEILERLISPEGTVPPVGRSLANRFSILHALAQPALLGDLPPALPPAQVRAAMTAVLHRMMDAPGTFDADGWLRIGLCGHQPGLAERYMSTGSLYGCALGFLPLGLPPGDPFWRDPARPWTAKRVWSGEDVPADKHLAPAQAN